MLSLDRLDGAFGMLGDAERIPALSEAQVAAREKGLGPDAIRITSSGAGEAVARVLVGEGEDGLPAVTLSWTRSGSHTDDPAWKAGEAWRLEIRARLSDDDRQKPEIHDALQTGKVLADLIPVVDTFWKPLIVAGQTGSPAAAANELVIEGSVEGLLGAVDKLGGVYGKTLIEAIKQAGLLPTFKVAKEIGFSWAGDKLKGILRDAISEKRETDR